MHLLRTFDLLTGLKESFPSKEDILARRVSSGWIKFSTDQYYDISHNIAYGILASGLQAESKVVTVTPNRPEWNFIDMALGLSGMVHVPVYPTLSTDEFKYIFQHSDTRVIFVGSEALYKKVSTTLDEMENPPELVMIDDCSDGRRCLRDIIDLGVRNKDEHYGTIERNKQTISKDSIATIIYTSGTTGTPKGVMLSHHNLMFNSHSHAVRQTLGSGQRVLSFLPLCHIYERTMNYEYQELGISIYYAENIGTIGRDMQESHCDGFCAVPRVLEMMYGKFEAAGKNLKGLNAKIYGYALDFADNYNIYNNDFLYKLKHRILDRLVFRHWRESLGGHRMIIVSGGSSIQTKIVCCFNAAGLSIFEGYGMTESSPVIAVNSPADGVNVVGTVGLKTEETELKFGEDGEILTRGPHVMMGYYKDPESTALAIDSEGWLHTGDIGCLQDGLYLKITDRKKEIFKLSAGKYVAPQAVENKLKESVFIDNVIVVGDNQKFASAIIIPDFHRSSLWAAERGLKFGSSAELAASPEVAELIHGEVEKVNATLAFHEQVKRERVAADEWTVANGLLSQTLKLKRAKILEKYDDLIKEIYRTEPKTEQNSSDD